MNRLFVAIPIPQPIGEILLAAVPHGDEWRKTPAENLHITCVFIGSVARDRIPDILASVRGIASITQPFSLILQTIRFDTAKEPKMIWAVFDPSDAFTELVKKLGRELHVHLHPEIIPHTTIARLKGTVDASSWQFNIHGPVTFTVASMKLYSSQTLPTGPVYTEIADFPFYVSDSPAHR